MLFLHTVSSYVTDIYCLCAFSQTDARKAETYCEITCAYFSNYTSYVGFLTLLYLQHKDLHFCNFMVMPLSPADEKHVSVILASGAVHAACCMNEHRHELMLKEWVLSEKVDCLLQLSDWLLLSPLNTYCDGLSHFLTYDYSLSFNSLHLRISHWPHCMILWPIV